MDEVLKTVMTKVAEHIVRLANDNKGKALAIADKASEFLTQEIVRITGQKPKQ